MTVFLPPPSTSTPVSRSQIINTIFGREALKWNTLFGQTKYKLELYSELHSELERKYDTMLGKLSENKIAFEKILHMNVVSSDISTYETFKTEIEKHSDKYYFCNFKKSLNVKDMSRHSCIVNSFISNI